MKKGITLILLLFVFVVSVGNTPATKKGNINADADSLGIDAEIRPLEEIPFSEEDALDKYISLAPKSIQVYYYTKRYCEEFDVPETVAFNVLKLETGYKGPMDLEYNPAQISSANAYGGYQILLSTGRDMYVILGLGMKHQLTKEILLNDVELNTKLGIAYLRYLHNNISRNWTIVCGFYNTGYPLINSYAIYATRYI